MRHLRRRARISHPPHRPRIADLLEELEFTVQW